MKRAWILVAALCATACGGRVDAAPFPDFGADAGSDAGSDSGADAGSDSGFTSARDSGVAAPPCAKPLTFYFDADGDGFGDPARTVLACSPPSAQWIKGGGDCDDEDGRAFPGQTGFFTAISAGGTWDFDCNGTIELEVPGVDSALCVCNVQSGQCSRSQGWRGPTTPACGETADYAAGLVSPTACDPMYVSKTQGCR